MMNSSGDLTGKILGNCTLEKLIGQGGMGAVYLARQQRPSRYVAVKVLLPKIFIRTEVYQAFLARFRREADAIAKLEHVNIMPIYEYGEQEGIAYLVMPYFPAGSLRDVLAAHGALSPQETLTYLEQAAAALDYAHAHGVIHRDVKPSNFLLHTDGRLVLADFGIARMVQDASTTLGTALTQTGMPLGTPEYMAPEMARGEMIDGRADIYELGIVLFQMLSGRVPFKGDTPLSVITKHLEQPLPALHAINPGISAAVDAVLQKATAKRREDRYSSAKALTQALRLAITSPDYFSETVSRNAPTMPSSRPVVLPAATPSHGTPPSVAQAMDFASAPTPGQPQAESLGRGPVTPMPYAPPVTPYNEPGLPRPWLPLLIILLIIVIALGGTFAALQLKGLFATPSPAATPPAVNAPTTAPTANPTIGLTVTPSPLPPTPTPSPTPAPSPAQQAQAVVQQYYADINNHDYQAAYNLWGASYQNANPESSFANGYTNTIHDAITFGTITPLADGTVQVQLTIQATENTSYGTATSVFQGYYIVGQENGTWKLLSSNIRKTA